MRFMRQSKALAEALTKSMTKALTVKACSGFVAGMLALGFISGASTAHREASCAAAPNRSSAMKARHPPGARRRGRNRQPAEERRKMAVSLPPFIFPGRLASTFPPVPSPPP